MSRECTRRLAAGEVALDDHEALVARLTAALPEARYIKQVIADDSHLCGGRVITFELLTAQEE